MRRILLTAAAVALSSSFAMAADMPARAPVYKAPAAVPSPVYGWTGFYIGVNGGYGWSDRNVDYTANDPNILLRTCGGLSGSTCASPASFNSNGGVAGGQIGYNWQLNTN